MEDSILSNRNREPEIMKHHIEHLHAKENSIIPGKNRSDKNVFCLDLRNKQILLMIVSKYKPFHQMVYILHM